MLSRALQELNSSLQACLAGNKDVESIVAGQGSCVLAVWGQLGTTVQKTNREIP